MSSISSFNNNVNNNNNYNNNNNNNSQISVNETSTETAQLVGTVGTGSATRGSLGERKISILEVVGLGVVAGGVVSAGIFSALALGFNDFAGVAGVSTAIALGIVGIIGLIYYAYSKITEPKAIRVTEHLQNVTGLDEDDETNSVGSSNSQTVNADSDDETSSIASSNSEASNAASVLKTSNDQEISKTHKTANKTQRAVTKTGARIDLTSAVNGAVRQARNVEKAMNLASKKDVTKNLQENVEEAMDLASKKDVTKNLQELNKQIALLRNKFTQYAVTVGFSEAYRILDSEIGKDTQQNTRLLYIYGPTHASVNLRDLILKGQGKIDNVDRLQGRPNFSEIEQGLLPGIQLNISHLIQKRFNESAHKDLNAAIDRLGEDIKRAGNVNDNQSKYFIKSNLALELKVNKDYTCENLGRVYKYSDNNRHFNGLVRGVVNGFVAQYRSNAEFDLKKESDTIAKKLEEALKFNDEGQTITEFRSQVTQKYIDAIDKLEAKKAEAELNRVNSVVDNELPKLEKGIIELQDKIINTLSSLNEKLRGLLIAQANVHQMHAKAAAANHDGKEYELDRLTAETVFNIRALEKDSKVLKVALDGFIYEVNKIDKRINKIKKEASAVDVKTPAASRRLSEQSVQIAALTKQMHTKENEINQFAQDSQAGKDLRSRINEIINGVAPSSFLSSISSGLAGIPTFIYSLTKRLPLPTTRKQETSAQDTPTQQSVLNGRVLDPNIKVEELSNDGEIVINNSINESDSETHDFRLALLDKTAVDQRDIRSIRKTVRFNVPHQQEDGFVPVSSELLSS
jgi:hypothetical protein